MNRAGYTADFNAPDVWLWEEKDYSGAWVWKCGFDRRQLQDREKWVRNEQRITRPAAQASEGEGGAVAHRWYEEWPVSQQNVLGKGRWLFAPAGEYAPDHAEPLYTHPVAQVAATPKHDEGREAEAAAEAWLTATARKAGPHGVSARDESLMRLGYKHGYLATQPAARRVTDADVERAAQAIADVVGHRMAEKCEAQARAALESFAQPAEGVSGVD